MQGSINNPGVQTERTHGKAGQLQQLANALFAVIMAALFIAGFFGMAVYYIVNSVEDRAALTLIFCFIGIAVFAAVVGVVGIGLYFIRNMGAAIVEHQSAGTTSTQMAFVQLVAEQRKTNEINQQLLAAALGNKQIPAPKISDGSGAFPIYSRGVEIAHTQQTAQPSAGWMYRLPDGRQARGDLIEAIINRGWDEYDSAQYPDFRTYVREVSRVGFGHDAYRLALDALKREGVCDEVGRFSVRQDEAQRLLSLMRARAR